MAKRFIDTGLFDDEWFMDLPKDSKILWLYMITRCNPAGFFVLNERLCKFQSGISDIEGALKGLQSRLEEPKKGLYFIKGFLEYQYPGFPNSNVRQQASAIKELQKYNLWDEEKQTIIKGASYPLQRVYGNGTGNGTDKGDVKGEEIKHPLQIFIKENYPNICKLKNQLTAIEAGKLLEQYNKELIKDKLAAMENKADLTKKYKSVYLTLLQWCKMQSVR